MIETALSLAVENPTPTAVLIGVVLVVVGPPVAQRLGGLVRDYWSPKIAGWRRWAGHVCQRMGNRLSGTGDPASTAPASTEPPASEEVRRFERV
ncbi:hypothetical protein ACFWCB_29105 [Streptomyces sp. NPDC060048]|uniref:hypothetical protein n=1 Tax=unclassified Streptomyces TaxID=2593676 RepID=UPI0036A63614